MKVRMYFNVPRNEASPSDEARPLYFCEVAITCTRDISASSADLLYQASLLSAMTMPSRYR